MDGNHDLPLHTPTLCLTIKALLAYRYYAPQLLHWLVKKKDFGLRKKAILEQIVLTLILGRTFWVGFYLVVKVLIPELHRITAIDTTCLSSSPNPMFDHLSG